MTAAQDVFLPAFNTRDLREFMRMVFPPEWGPIAARVIESGASMSEMMCPWAPRWSQIPPTMRYGQSELETAVKSCMFRAHDCIHQLWGLPIPGVAFSEADFYVYKRSQMCGEVAVLTIAECFLSHRLYEQYAELRPLLWSRNALPMLDGPLRGRSWAQVAARLDGVLHKKRRPKWLRDDPASTAFADDYVPMLERDRMDVDHNWGIMSRANWRPVGAPNARYNPDLDGLELTTWMIEDFRHLLDTDPAIDEELAAFNRERRRGIVLPPGWGLQ